MALAADFGASGEIMSQRRARDYIMCERTESQVVFGLRWLAQECWPASFPASLVGADRAGECSAECARCRARERHSGAPQHLTSGAFAGSGRAQFARKSHLLRASSPTVAPAARLECTLRRRTIRVFDGVKLK